MFKKGFGAALVLALTVGSLLTGMIGVSRAGLLVVDDDGVGCGGYPSTHSSIQAAIDDASPGDTVLVCPGVYRESVSVWKDDLKVRSLDGSAVDGSADTVISPDELAPAVKISNSGVKFFGFYVRDETAGHVDHRHVGILVDGNYNLVMNNLVEMRGVSGQFDGAIVVGELGAGVSKNNVVSGNVVRDAVYGILAQFASPSDSADGTLVSFNTVEQSVFGISVLGAPRTVVEFNTVTNNMAGLFFGGGDGSVFRCNDVYLNMFVEAQNVAGDGVEMVASHNWWGSPLGPDPGKIVGNVVYEPWLDGSFTTVEGCTPLSRSTTTTLTSTATVSTTTTGTTVRTSTTTSTETRTATVTSTVTATQTSTATTTQTQTNTSLTTLTSTATTTSTTFTTVSVVQYSTTTVTTVNTSHTTTTFTSTVPTVVTTTSTVPVSVTFTSWTNATLSITETVVENVTNYLTSIVSATATTTLQETRQVVVYVTETFTQTVDLVSSSPLLPLAIVAIAALVAVLLISWLRRRPEERTGIPTPPPPFSPSI